MYLIIQEYEGNFVFVSFYQRTSQMWTNSLFSPSLVEADSSDDDLSDRVGVAVAGRSPVLQVAVALLRHIPGDPDAAAPVGHPGTEVVDAGGLVESSQPPLIVLALVGVVRHDMSLVVPGEVVDGGLYGLHTSWHPHGLSGEVAVSSSSIPVSRHWLGIKSNDNPEVLRHPAEEVAGDPEVVPRVDALSWPDLVLPLGRHDLSVGAGHPDPGVETGAVVSLHDVPAVDLVGPDPAVVGALGAGEPVLGPPEGMLVLVQQSVLLLDTEPGMVILGLLHHLLTSLPLVGVSGKLVVLVGLAQDQDVVASSEGVRVDLHRVKVSVGVGALGLVCGAPVIVPDWKILDTFRFGVQGLGLVPDPLASPVNPDVASLDSSILLQLEVLAQHSLVCLSVLIHLQLQLTLSPWSWAGE